MKTGIVNYSMSSQAGLRFDASFHLSEGLVVKRKIASSPYKMLTMQDVASDIFYGNRAKRVYVTKRENGIPFLSSSDILQADLENVKLASKKYTPCIEQMMLDKGWTLISRSGTIGNCAFANAKHAQKLASEHVIRLVPNNILRGGLVYAYLASKQGHSLLTQGTFGAVIQHIEPNFIASLPIPQFPEGFQQEVDNLIQESAQLREEATDALEEAHSLIESKFDMTLFSNKFGGVNIKEVTAGSMYRFDSSYHLSDSAKFEKLIFKRNYVTLATLCSDIFGGGRAKRYYTADKSRGVPFLSNSDLGKANPLRTCKYSLRTRGFDESSILKKGMIVTGRVGAIGQTQFIGEEFERLQVMGSDNVIRIVPKTNSGYIYAYLSSKIGNSMFWKYATGGVQPFISSAMVGQILVPLFEDEIIHRCNDLIELYSSKKEMSNIKENQAIRMVEEEIEKWNN